MTPGLHEFLMVAGPLVAFVSVFKMTLAVELALLDWIER